MGINGSGQIVGYYQPNFFGFLDNGGTHTTLNDSLGTHGTLEHQAREPDRGVLRGRWNCFRLSHCHARPSQQTLLTTLQHV